MRTTPPLDGRTAILYDGLCSLCTNGASRLVASGGELRAVDFQVEGALAPFPGLTHTLCMARLHVVEPDGSVFSGARAIARLLARRPGFGWVATAYGLPGLPRLAEAAYDVVAALRYRLWGKPSCSGGTCRLHG